MQIRNAPPAQAREAAPADKPADVGEEIRALRDLFERRLLEDKAKQRLYDELYGHVAAMREGVTGAVLGPLVTELLLVVDRVRGATEADAEFLDSVAEEILEALRRHEVSEVPADGAFDPNLHEAVRTVAASDDHPAGTVAEVVRPGYRLGGRLLRPARVVLAVPGPEKEHE